MSNALIDATTGQPFPPKGDQATGAALVELVGGGINFDTSGLATEATQAAIEGLLATPATSLPPKARVPLTDPNAPDMVPVNFTNSSPQTIENADSSLAWSVYGWLLSFSVACTLTIEGGSEDLVIDIPSAGIWDLADRELAVTTAAVNTALTITVSAGTCKGALYAKKA